MFFVFYSAKNIVDAASVSYIIPLVEIEIQKKKSLKVYRAIMNYLLRLSLADEIFQLLSA